MCLIIKGLQKCSVVCVCLHKDPLGLVALNLRLWFYALVWYGTT